MTAPSLARIDLPLRPPFPLITIAIAAKLSIKVKLRNTVAGFFSFAAVWYCMQGTFHSLLSAIPHF